MDDFTLSIEKAPRRINLFPQFSSPSLPGYIQEIPPDAKHFVGWRPYGIRSWAEATHKLKFKKYLFSRDLPTPWYSTDPQVKHDNVIIKCDRSSFSKGIKGPYRCSSEQPLDKGKGEYYEQYIEGKIVKIWYWKHQPVAAEVVQPVNVIGNGHSSIKELILAYAQLINRSVEIPYFEEFLKFQGLSLDDIPASAQQCSIDFRYKSPFPVSQHGRDVQINKDPFYGLESELSRIGNTVWHDIPEDLRQNLVYCIDGVVDNQNKLWVIEMNMNPFVHPFVYMPMVQDLLKQPNVPQIPRSMAPAI